MNLRRHLKYLQLRVLRQRDRAESIAAGSALGFIVGIVFPPGTHMFAAAALATVLGCNLLAAVAWTWVTNPLTIPLLYPFAFEVGSWVTGLRVQDVIPTKHEHFWIFISDFRSHGRAAMLLLAGLLTLASIGTLPVYYGMKFAILHHRARILPRPPRPE